jgi:hypothetical protein
MMEILNALSLTLSQYHQLDNFGDSNETLRRGDLSDAELQDLVKRNFVQLKDGSAYLRKTRLGAKYQWMFSEVKKSIQQTPDRQPPK